MVSLLVTVFVIQLVCHLVLTIGSKPINNLVCRSFVSPDGRPLLTYPESYGKYTAAYPSNPPEIFKNKSDYVAKSSD